MSIKSNIWKLQADRFFSWAWIIGPVLVPYYQANGLSASDVFIIQSIYAATMVICDIPTGYFSDAVGRRTTMILGAILLPIGLCAYLLADNFWLFVVAEIMLGIAVSLRSGTDSSMLYDTLLQLKREKEHTSIEGQAFLFQQIGSALANISGGLLSAISLSWAFIANAITSLALLPLSLSLKEPKRDKQTPKNARMHFADLKKAVKYTATHPTIRNIILYMAITEAVNMTAYWSNYLLYASLNVPIAYFGFIAAAGSLLFGVGGKLAHVIEKRFGLKWSLILPLMGAPVFLLIGNLHSYWAIILCMASFFCWGISFPLIKDILHKNTASHIRATVLSTGNMFSRLTFIIISVLVGQYVGISDIQHGYLLLGCLLFVGGLYPIWSLLRLKESS